MVTIGLGKARLTDVPRGYWSSPDVAAGLELLERFNPQWHHIYPRAYLNKQHVAAERWDLFANIAIIAPTTNIKIGDKSPPQYLAKYAISDARLAEQLIPLPASDLIIANFETFLNRARQGPSRRT